VHPFGELAHVEGSQQVGEEGDDALEEKVEEKDAAGAAEKSVEDHRQSTHFRLWRRAPVSCNKVIKRSLEQFLAI